MKKKHIVLILSQIMLISCFLETEKKNLEFVDFPNLQIGFSTQNFQSSISQDIEDLTELIIFAAEQGFNFIQLRDNFATLSPDVCKEFAEIAQENNIKVIYEIQVGLLDADFQEVYDRALNNMDYFLDPGILRSLISNSEFKDDDNKIGWSKDEFAELVKIANHCGQIAKSKNIQFIVENFNEPFFGDSLTFFGLSDFFNDTQEVYFQFDMSNPYSSTSRKITDPSEVINYVSGIKERCVVTHLKTIGEIGGIMQSVINDNPLTVEKVIEVMGANNIKYISLELASENDKRQCFDNHIASVKFLKEKGILK